MSNQIIKLDFNEEQLHLIKSQIARDCDNNELALFLNQCKRTGLDPLTRQIYAIKRAGRMTIQTSIDGFRVIAERSGTYAGQDEPVWVDDEKGKPIKCTVTVYRFAPNGQRYPAGVGVAHFNEYYPNPMNLQKTMPHTMIAKVAEALALRKAFPQDLSGLYTNDEMVQSTKEMDEQTIDAAFEDVPDKSEKDLLRKLVYNSTFDENDRLKYLEAIDVCDNYNTYQKIQHKLEDRQIPFDQIPNPNQTDIKNHVNKVVNG